MVGPLFTIKRACFQEGTVLRDSNLNAVSFLPINTHLNSKIADILSLCTIDFSWEGEPIFVRIL